MKNIVETKEKYIIQRYFVNRVHKKSLFSVEIYPGIVAEFGEPKSKLGSRKYNLTKLSFLKEMPYSDQRIFEELVAEIFKEFGYSIELTKKQEMEAKI